MHGNPHSSENKPLKALGKDIYNGLALLDWADHICFLSLIYTTGCETGMTYVVAIVVYSSKAIPLLLLTAQLKQLHFLLHKCYEQYNLDKGIWAAEFSRNTFCF